MFRIKRIYTFILQTFLPVFCMTFCICLFIVLMQFLWSYVDDFVGKGLGIGVMGELFFYAALKFIPLALPLAILLASLMTFGNLGESLELTAMKSSGISLIKIMRPLIIVIVSISIGAFYFQNDILPMVNTKMYSLFIGIKTKSPELEIPEGVFYKEINDYNIYVGRKDHDTGLLYDVIIYIFDGNNIENATVTLADTAKMQIAGDNKHLKLTLWSGEQVGTFKDGNSRPDPKHPKYRRESFTCKEVFIPYSNDLERTDESMISSREVGKNFHELRMSVDSLDRRIDSINTGYGEQLKERTYFKMVTTEARNDSAYFAKVAPKKNATAPIDIDSVYASLRPEQMQQIVEKAESRSNAVIQTFDIRTQMQAIEYKNRSRHEIEMHKKFTLSMACLIFFFIGAPLGAIIRKGGISVPIIVSVLFFIIYYLIDNTGIKMARNDEWPSWVGVWFSSFVLAPFGIFLTWRAINDSTLFDWDSYVIYFKRFFKDVIAFYNKHIGKDLRIWKKKSN